MRGLGLLHPGPTEASVGSREEPPIPTRELDESDDEWALEVLFALPRLPALELSNEENVEGVSMAVPGGEMELGVARFELGHLD